jgi:Uma2 family endonuclease
MPFQNQRNGFTWLQPGVYTLSSWSRNLEVALANYLSAHPIGVLYDAPFDVYLPKRDRRLPARPLGRTERESRNPDGRRCLRPPDFVVEVLSPRTRQLDLAHKKRVYARIGVKELWIIDPDQQQNITVYRFDQDPADPIEKLSGEGEISSPLLPRFQIPLHDLFRRG